MTHDTTTKARTSFWSTVRCWFDASGGARSGLRSGQIDWARLLPFLAMHAGCLLVIPAGVSVTALAVAAVLYLVRMFAITAFYHRYFSHRTFRTSRTFQFVMGFAGALSAQRGPIWWASHHRHHHRTADTDADLHSPVRHGFWRSHLLWFATAEGFRVHAYLVKDLERYPELRLLDRFNTAPPLLLGGALYAAGAWLARHAPALGVDGLQLLAWGFFVSTVVLYHATYTINSLAHVFGSRRYCVADRSRNNAVLALITLGEGWHNNHHRYPHAVRQGFFWWEIDPTWWGLRLLAALRIIRDLRPVPREIIEEGRRGPCGAIVKAGAGPVR